MKKVKFRIWDDVHKILIYLDSPCVTLYNLKVDVDTFDYYEIITDENGNFYCRAFDEFDDDYGFQMMNVTEFPLQQYIGNDMYGVEIYEDDIVEEGCNGFIASVIYDERLGTYRLSGLGEDYTFKDAHIEWKKIGNIYENKELIDNYEKV